MRTPPRILVVDDNPENLEIFRARLASHGYEILTARDGEEALATARNALPDLILLDIMMPKVDGIEVCRQLRADPAFPFTPIIMVTARSDSKDIVAGLAAGGDEYLTKPVDQASLVARVKSMLRIKQLHDTVQEQAAELSRWNRELEERVKQQTATSEILRVISSSPTDIQPVFDAVAESAARLCDSTDAEIFRREHDRLLLVAHHG